MTQININLFIENLSTIINRSDLYIAHTPHNVSIRSLRGDIHIEANTVGDLYERYTFWLEKTLTSISTRIQTVDSPLANTIRVSDISLSTM